MIILIDLPFDTQSIGTETISAPLLASNSIAVLTAAATSGSTMSESKK